MVPTRVGAKRTTAQAEIFVSGGDRERKQLGDGQGDGVVGDADGQSGNVGQQYRAPRRGTQVHQGILAAQFDGAEGREQHRRTREQCDRRGAQPAPRRIPKALRDLIAR
ncbi:hypothetical protein ACFW9L_05320 [Streptomyces sp. NPDC059517]|uniref:hypothetical protein n=1 Tax=Streptomyces sp. NPDC059517 TaxID=3346855 RepID=UPI0036A7AE00